MRRSTFAALALGTALLAGTADAQTRTLGNTDAAISQALAAFGFAPAFRIVDRELVRTVIDACKGRDMFRVSVNVLGAVKTKQRLGRCDIPGVQVQGEPRRPNRGDPEPAGLSEREIGAKLAEQGYDRIEFKQSNGRRTVVQACDGNNRQLELRLNRRGEIRRSNVIGRCVARAGTDAIQRRLEQAGFDEIEFETQRAPYGVLACNDGVRQRLIVDRRGRVVSRERAGRCGPAINAEVLTKRLRDRGLTRVSVKADGNRYRATACRRTAKINFVFNRRGERIERKRNGDCSSRSVADVLERLESRGGQSLDLFVEGCFRGNRFRWSFDELGERTGRERVGSC